MNAFTILGLIILGIVIIAVLIAMFEKGPCQPNDYYKGWKK
jgi:hypothetical protein